MAESIPLTNSIFCRRRKNERDMKVVSMALRQRENNGCNIPPPPPLLLLPYCRQAFTPNSPNSHSGNHLIDVLFSLVRLASSKMAL